ncbi:MAG: hypothetical protein R2800_01925 [Flavipsychrobacter sp.]
MEKEEIIEQLRKFRWIDKYHNFRDLLPTIEQSSDDDKDIINNIVEDCCTELIRIYNTSKRKPTKALLGKTILQYMDDISYTKVDELNKDFGYELCWYIAEKVGVDLRKQSTTKVYGYWSIVENNLKTVTKRGKRKKGEK